MKRTVIAILFLIISLSAKTQQADSCTMEISLITCAPGNDLYSIFGHTAIRVRDTATGMDIVYNYGTFDDTDPLFYVHFTNGIMNYSLSAETMDRFMMEYQYDQRSVYAQVLNLTCSEKRRLYEALRKNTLEENRIYQYHFHTDNCTTRAARMLEDNTGAVLTYKQILPNPGPTFRDMIHEYLDRQHQSWSEFGIDLLLGKNLDVKPSNTEAIHFLPDYLYRGMDGARFGTAPAVLGVQSLLQFPLAKTGISGISPSAFFKILLFLVITLFIFRKNNSSRKSLLFFDLVFFGFLGLLGILIAYLWIARVDNVCQDNLNILWALPTHAVAVFFIRKNTPWVRYYFLATAIIAAILAAGFLWWPQKLNSAFFVILCIIVFRAFMIFLNRQYAEKNTTAGKNA